MKYLIQTAMDAAIEAGKVILEIYDTNFNVEYKADHSPLTEADKKSNHVIRKYLCNTNIPILSEEEKEIPFVKRKQWNQLWIVDPLDGTKEFIKRNGEFTVNIALVEDNMVVAGVVYVPVQDILYVGIIGSGSYKIEMASQKTNLTAQMNNKNKLRIKQNRQYIGIVVSRSHLNRETTNFIEKLKNDYPKTKIIPCGSALKLCLVAEEKADIYPRFAPTSEWDTAAGHAIIKASGGNVYKADKIEEEITYNKEDVLNPFFIAMSNSFCLMEIT